jgi:hypothetical protein
VQLVPNYLVETYLARSAGDARRAHELQSRLAAAALTRAGTRVRFHGSIHVPEDETCFFTFEAPSAVEAALAARRAGLEPLRVVEAISSQKERT